MLLRGHTHETTMVSGHVRMLLNEEKLARGARIALIMMPRISRHDEPYERPFTESLEIVM